MALPIKDTPVLFGKDAKAFIEEMDKNKDKRISDEERIQMENNFVFMMNIACGGIR